MLPQDEEIADSPETITQQMYESVFADLEVEVEQTDRREADEAARGGKDKVQEDMMTVRTIGQMRALIMDFPVSLLAANFFKAFSDGTRLRLLQALSVREMCVSDLCTLLELSQPAISNHLRVLNHQRIIKMRRSGKNIFYSLDDWHINAIIGMAMEHLSFTGTEQR
jgi:DNA-binding transcriptional ArsR family regulator